MTPTSGAYPSRKAPFQDRLRWSRGRKSKGQRSSPAKRTDFLRLRLNSVGVDHPKRGRRRHIQFEDIACGVSPVVVLAVQSPKNSDVPLPDWSITFATNPPKHAPTRWPKRPANHMDHALVQCSLMIYSGHHASLSARGRDPRVSALPRGSLVSGQGQCSHRNRVGVERTWISVAEGLRPV